MEEEIRYYKGKYKVKVLKKSRGNWLVEALENIQWIGLWRILKGAEFTTIKRLLWKRKRRNE